MFFAASDPCIMSQVAFPASKTIHPNENNGIFLEVTGEISYLRILGHQERASLVDTSGLSEVAGLGVSGAVRQWEGWPRKGRGKILKTHLAELYELLMDNFFIWPGIQCHAGAILSLLPSLLDQGFCHGPSASHCVGHSFNKCFLRTLLISGSELDVGVRHCSASIPVLDCS